MALLAAGAVVGVPALRRLLPSGTLSAVRGLPATILSRGLLTFTFFGADAFVTLAITRPLHGSAAMASAVITVSTLAWSAAAWLQARLNDQWESRRLIRLGLLLILAGIVGIVFALRAGLPAATTLASWSAAGFGMGLAYAPISLLMLRQAPSGRTGWASASLNLSDVLGTAIGAGLGGAALVLSSNRGWPIATGITIAFCVAGAGSIAALAVTRRL
jgi:MFS family permease